MDFDVELANKMSAPQIVIHLARASLLADTSIDWPALVTAASTVVLTLATAVLAWFTWLLFSATHDPFVVATIESNPRSMRHLDLHVQNEGTAAAFDVLLSFDPPMPTRSGLADGPAPLSKISVLRAGQKLTSFLDNYEKLSATPYQVTIVWSSRPSGRQQKLSYVIDLKSMEGMNRLGDDPLVQIAEELKHLRDDWKSIASGAKRIEVDAFDEHDRLREERKTARWLRVQRRRDINSSSGSESAPD